MNDIELKEFSKELGCNYELLSAAYDSMAQVDYIDEFVKYESIHNSEREMIFPIEMINSVIKNMKPEAAFELGVKYGLSYEARYFNKKGYFYSIAELEHEIYLKSLMNDNFFSYLCRECEEFREKELGVFDFTFAIDK